MKGNDAIQKIFVDFFGTLNSLAPMLAYAIIVTIIAIVATIWITDVAEKVK